MQRQLSIFFSENKICPILKGQLSFLKLSSTHPGGAQIPQGLFNKRYKAKKLSFAISTELKAFESYNRHLKN